MAPPTPLATPATRYAIIDAGDDVLVIDGMFFGSLKDLYTTMSCCSSRHHTILSVYAVDFIRGTMTDITREAIEGWWDAEGHTDTVEKRLAEADVSVFAEMLKRAPPAPSFLRPAVSLAPVEA